MGGLAMIRRVHSKEVMQAALIKLAARGVEIQDIATIVFEMQQKYNPQLTMFHCIGSVRRVLEKREMLHALLVGIELDELAEKGMLSEPLLSIVQADEGLFGCDETLALGSVFAFGSIAVTTFGHLDKNKIGIIQKVDQKDGIRVNTFLDDLIAGIAAAAASRIAHKTRDAEELEIEEKQSDIEV
jgi:phosphatidylglycerophosphatase A